MNQKTAIIIGAGPAGLTAAYELLDKTDIKPIIYETTDSLGGISKTVNYKGNRIDLGGHRFFSKSDRIMQWWQNILPLQGSPSKDDIILGRDIMLSEKVDAPDPEEVDRVMLVRNRLSRIFFLGKFFDYPISLNFNTFFNLGFIRVIKIGLSYIKSRLFPIKNERSLEDFFINRFGKELYLTFFRDYTEKVWGVPCSKIKPEWGAQRVKGLFSKLGFNLTLKLSRFLVTGSERLKKGYAKHYRLKLENIKVLPNWVNLARFNRSRLTRIVTQKNAEKVILFVHWLAERKGAHFVVPIAKQLSKIQNTKYKILIVGDGPLKNKIQKEIKENNLEDYIQVLGKVPNKELMEYYAQADIFIMPSLQEGFPHVLLEAMAMGIPYVAADVGAVREISPKIAQDFMVDPIRYSLSNGVERGNIDEFAKKIKILLSNQEIYNQFREEELEKVKEYSLEKMIDKFINLFR